mgnify:CR=1 FL=1
MAVFVVPKKIEKELKAASKKLGISREELLLNAVLYYLQILERKTELKKELEVWEKTSDIDLKKFEKSIWDEEGDVCIINLSSGFGYEQYGQRPAVLISDTNFGIIIVIPLTLNLEALRFPYTLTISPNKQNNLKQKSIALIFHIRAIDKTRVSKIIGRINKRIQKKIDSILREMLKL